jgi:tetratricopeptide (TPR) repeat protein
MSFEKDEQQNVDALINRAQALIDIRRYQEALKLLRQALVIAPDNSDILCHVSYVKLQIGEFEQALSDADRAVQSQPRNEWGHRLRSFALLRLGKKSDALGAAEEAVRLAPQSPQTFYSLADSQIANQMLSEARQSALRAREMAPESPESHEILASVEIGHKSWGEAEKHLRKALSLRPTSYNALNDLGVCLLRQGREREALEMFRQAARANPAGEDARDNLKSLAANYLPGKDAMSICVLVLSIVSITAVISGGSWIVIIAMFILPGIPVGILDIILSRILPSQSKDTIIICVFGVGILVMTAVISRGSWIAIIAMLVLPPMTYGILEISLSRIPPSHSKEFKEFPPDVQNFLRAERRRERIYDAARSARGLSAIILIWWGAIRMLGPGPVFPRSATGWAIFASLLACFVISAAILFNRDA